MKKKYSREERQKHRAEDNRLFILEAAEKVFSQRGYTQSTMDEIADEAQFSKATLYRYYKSKSDIFMGVIVSSFADVLAELETIRSKEKEAGDKLRELIRIVLDYLRKKKNMIRIFYAEKDAMSRIFKIGPHNHFSHTALQAKIPKDFLAKGKDIAGTITQIVQMGIDSGEFRSVNPERAGIVLEAMLRGVAFQSPFLSKEISLEENTKMIHEYFLHGIRKHKDTIKEKTK